MMASKIFTAQDMRETAERFAFEEDSSRSNTIVAMLRQAADALEREEQIRREIKKIDTMEVAPLDGHPMHQRTNTEKVATILTFLPKVKKILGGAKTLERKESHAKKYEYAVEHLDFFGKWVVYEDGLSLAEAKKLSREKWSSPHRIVRREVGEREEVTDGD